MYSKVNADTLPHFNSQELQDIDQSSINSFGMSSELLMECAGFQSALFISRMVEDKHVFIFCGHGNNSGDGFVCARHLQLLQIPVSIVLCSEKDKYSDLVMQQYERCSLISIPLLTFNEWSTLKDFSSHLYVDALLGIGLKGALRKPYKDIVQALNKHKNLTISLDVPSGFYDDIDIDVDSYVKSDILLSFGCLKQSFLRTHPLLGRIYLLYIGLYSEYSSSFVKRSIAEIIY
ncbi:NAD(P)H-hydrate epimerase [Candidatus Marinamargulisbacteria bacterium SCGC AG-343-D04]|nr:NAD(P)H-hydrate epimerase [Candidatus Marinamargulisbacteria bacterium SCGC AG-343-D04]